MSVRDHQREEHMAWVDVMTKFKAAGVNINAIPRDVFSEIEERLREWAVAYVRLCLPSESAVPHA